MLSKACGLSNRNDSFDLLGGFTQTIRITTWERGLSAPGFSNGDIFETVGASAIVEFLNSVTNLKVD
jgi:hypothetical protein